MSKQFKVTCTAKSCIHVFDKLYAMLKPSSRGTQGFGKLSSFALRTELGDLRSFKFGFILPSEIAEGKPDKLRNVKGLDNESFDKMCEIGEMIGGKWVSEDSSIKLSLGFQAIQDGLCVGSVIGLVTSDEFSSINEALSQFDPVSYKVAASFNKEHCSSHPDGVVSIIHGDWIPDKFDPENRAMIKYQVTTINLIDGTHFGGPVSSVTVDYFEPVRDGDIELNFTEWMYEQARDMNERSRDELSL
jgi:hypothetical protein